MKTLSKPYFAVLIAIMMFVSACQPQSAAQSQSSTIQSIATAQATIAALPNAAATNNEIEPNPNAPHQDELDDTHLPLGDGKTSPNPQRGHVYSCQTQFNGGGAEGNPPWIDTSKGTWNLKAKISVNGSVDWPQHSFTMSIQDDQRIFTTNDLPDHPSGVFPIHPSDPAYKLDRNPNSIKAQSIRFNVPANPTIAPEPTCVGGEVGIMLSGVLLFSAFDAEGRDAVAHEVQDHCDGHPQEGGYYHYHGLSSCLKDNPTGQSALLGYAFDGFGIYGPYDANGKELTDADLDECHGITSEVEWEGKQVAMYHYVATRDFPYVVGCFRGTPAVRALTTNGPGGAGGGQQPGTNQQPSGNPQGGGNGQPPQAAINACANSAAGAACSFNTPNGGINGTCQTPPQPGQLVCVPQGGPRNP
jgi:hypothetical protein